MTSFDEKEWKGRPDRSTPVNAAALNDLEARIGDAVTELDEAIDGAGQVASVNGETGTVVLDAADVGAAPASHTHAQADVTGLTAALAAKQDAASAATQAELDAHAADTTAVHGIADTSKVALWDAANPADTVISAVTGQPVLAGSGGAILPWATGEEYVIGQAVTSGGVTYTANDDHTAGATFAGDLTAHWTALPSGANAPIRTMESVQLWVFGHSWLTGSSGWAGIGKPLHPRNNMDSYNARSSAGTTAGAMVAQIRTLNGAVLFGLNIVCSTINNATGLHTVATVREEWRSALAHLTARVAQASNNSVLTYGSGWTAGVTTTPGSYVDVSWNGDSVYVAVDFTTGASNVINVLNSGTGSAVAQSVETAGYSEAFIGVIRLAGYGAGNHVVRLVSTGAGATIRNVLVPNAAPATILWVKEPSLPGLNGAQNTAMANFQTAITAILGDFPTVLPVDLPGFNTATMLLADQVHPNDAGVNYVVDQMEAVLRPLPYRQGQNYITGKAAASYSASPIVFVP